MDTSTTTTSTTTHKGDDQRRDQGRRAEGGKESLDEQGLQENSDVYRESTGDESIENAKAEAMANSNLEDGELNPENYRSGDKFEMGAEGEGEGEDEDEVSPTSNRDPQARNR